MDGITLWEHPHDSTSLPLFSSSLFSSQLSFLCSVLLFSQLSLPLSNPSLCSALQNQALLPITAKHSFSPSISFSDHPSLTCQSTLTALAKWPFSCLKMLALIHQAMPANFAYVGDPDVIQHHNFTRMTLSTPLC